MNLTARIKYSIIKAEVPSKNLIMYLMLTSTFLSDLHMLILIGQYLENSPSRPPNPTKKLKSKSLQQEPPTSVRAASFHI